MVRILRRFSIASFALAAALLLLHGLSLVLRISLEIRQVYVLDFLLTADAASALGGMDAFIYHLLRWGVWYGVGAQAFFLLAQLLAEMSDVSHVRRLGDTSENQLRILSADEHQVLGLLDRLIPMIALGVLSFILLREWLSSSVILSYAELTRRHVLLPTLTFTVSTWTAAFFLSFLISLVFLWYFHARMRDIYSALQNDPQPVEMRK